MDLYCVIIIGHLVVCVALVCVQVECKDESGPLKNDGLVILVFAGHVAGVSSQPSVLFLGATKETDLKFQFHERKKKISTTLVEGLIINRQSSVTILFINFTLISLLSAPKRECQNEIFTIGSKFKSN